MTGGPADRRTADGRRWADVQWALGGRAVGFFFFWNVGTVGRGLPTSPKFSFFCIFLLLADVPSDNWWA
jgi:hypothetical protein